MSIELINKLKQIGNWILRNLLWVGIILIAGYFIQPTKELIGKFLVIILLEGIALGMSGLALYVYTKVDFSKKLMDGGNGELSKFEQLGASIVTGLIFVGVHILVAGTFFILQLEVL